MKRPEDLQRLRHMRGHAQEAVRMVENQTREDLAVDRKLQLALVRLVEIVGEAAARVSEQGQEKWDTVPWAPARGMRNRLIHGYDSVDLNILLEYTEGRLSPADCRIRADSQRRAMTQRDSRL